MIDPQAVNLKSKCTTADGKKRGTTQVMHGGGWDIMDVPTALKSGTAAKCEFVIVAQLPTAAPMEKLSQECYLVGSEQMLGVFWRRSGTRKGRSA